jgi:hypothetical protein
MVQRVQHAQRRQRVEVFHGSRRIGGIFRHEQPRDPALSETLLVNHPPEGKVRGRRDRRDAQLRLPRLRRPSKPKPVVAGEYRIDHLPLGQIRREVEKGREQRVEEEDGQSETFAAFRLDPFEPPFRRGFFFRRDARVIAPWDRLQQPRSSTELRRSVDTVVATHIDQHSPGQLGELERPLVARPQPGKRCQQADMEKVYIAHLRLSGVTSTGSLYIQTVHLEQVGLGPADNLDQIDGERSGPLDAGETRADHHKAGNEEWWGRGYLKRPAVRSEPPARLAECAGWVVGAGTCQSSLPSVASRIVPPTRYQRVHGEERRRHAKGLAVGQSLRRGCDFSRHTHRPSSPRLVMTRSYTSRSSQNRDHLLSSGTSAGSTCTSSKWPDVPTTNGRLGW